LGGIYTDIPPVATPLVEYTYDLSRDPKAGSST